MPGYDVFHLKSNHTTTYDITRPTASAISRLGRGTKRIKKRLFWAYFGLKRQQKTLFPMDFPLLGAHLRGAKFQHPDFTWKELCGQMAHLVFPCFINTQFSQLLTLKDYSTTLKNYPTTLFHY